MGDLEAIVYVSVLDKDGKIKKDFEIDSVRNNYYPVEAQKCGIYVTKMFNYDYKIWKQKPGNKYELWRYNYNNKGKQITLLNEKKLISGIYYSYYETDFRVHSTEKYAALTRSYAGSPVHAFVIKNLKTLEDDFVLPVKDIIDKYPGAAGGSSGLNLWSKDGRYFWGNLSDGADVLAFIRIEAETWKWDVFPAPAGTMGGDVINPENGWVTYDDGIPWTGDADLTEEYIKEWKKEGKKIHFYIYNLITKEQILLATIGDPSWGFGKKWISATELEYTLPGEVKKVYKIELK